ncbi:MULTISPECIES: FtsK/SpoIIIE domain-containing protein [unclassified Arthrobacter]|uniref:FtsK/SpoIIIE domain-containing protein n=1 Tax=unclassified Arthrobacter TaxID=235627 RepID=UPI0014922112|nr:MULTISPECIES: FtsK/SpoIIIE domain-containing protein [unclassified Arthrobacter]MBE0008675.1 FHA domain-containing protein [Arthrobacter sp. AET 35A]NOJ62508.1 FHA domain-containing protein [Arthrobacter sp. 147(2020)]
MLLHLSLVGAPGVARPAPGTVVELVVDTSIVDSALALRALLLEQHTGAACAVAGRPLESLTLGVAPLVNGAVIVAGGGQPSRTRRGLLPNLVLVTSTGPDAGQLIGLRRGSYTIGRDNCDMVLADPAVSRHHARLTVEKNQVTLYDVASANGTWVDGVRVEEAAISVDSDLRFGNSCCRLVLLDQVAPTPRIPSLADPLEVQAVAPRPASVLLLGSALLPLVLGVVLALATGMWIFLGFSVLSATAALIPLVTGRRARRAFLAALANAAREDRRRRLAASDEIGRLAAAAYSPATGDPPAPGEPSSAPVYVRLGLATQGAHLVVKPADAVWTCPLLNDVPVLIELTIGTRAIGPPEVCFAGSGRDLLGMARSLLLQLCNRPGTAVCVGTPADLPGDARFLPGVILACPADIAALPETMEQVPVLLFGSAAADPVPRAAAIFRFGCTPGELSPGAGTVREAVTLGRGGAELRGIRTINFQPDLVSGQSFGRLARALGGRRSPVCGEREQPSRSDPPVLPPRISLDRIAPSTPDQLLQAWAGPLPGLTAAIGSNAEGVQLFDLVSDGPHLVIAGTTGSGKSELLRTLILSVALNHSPSEVNFLLIDFKGGAGLRPLSALPHAVGLLTDLSAASVARALVSLLAELRRREQLFATHLVTDIADWPAHRPPLPRLVVVIDEFRMLLEDVPGAAGELVRLATVGRSLGVHLVMSTQRPQGALGPDIRANVSASIALRVSSPLESHDIVGSAAAAAIPVNIPGRALLRLGTGPARLFQAASTGPDSEGSVPGVIEWTTSLLRPTSPVAGMRSRETRGPAGLIAAVATAAGGFRYGPLHSPVLPGLPPVLTALTMPPAPEGAVVLGLLDLPEAQTQRPLLWFPGNDSHLALIGQSVAGTAGALVQVVSGLVETLPDRHLYILDGDGTLRWVASAPQVGAYVGAQEPRRAARVIRRLADEVTERLSRDTAPASGRGQDQRLDPALTVVVSGWGRWMGELRASRWPWAEELLQDLARDGQLAGTTLVISGDRDVVTGRFFPLLPNRLYFPLGATRESTFSWPKLPPTEPVPGRCLAQGPIATPEGAVAQVILGRREASRAQGAAAVAPVRAPFRVAPLPTFIQGSNPLFNAAPGDSHRIPIGVGGDEADVVFLTLTRRLVFLIVGPPGSGRSTLIEQLAAASSTSCVRPAPGSDPVDFWAGQARLLAGTGGPPAESLLLVDDADHLPQDTQRHLGQLFAQGYRLILAVTDGASILMKVPLAAEARSSRTGMILGPRQASDGDFFGVRLDCDARPRPGRGFLFDAGEVREVQVAVPGQAGRVG